MLEVVEEYRGAYEPKGSFVRSASGLVREVKARTVNKGHPDYHNSRVVVFGTYEELLSLGATPLVDARWQIRHKNEVAQFFVHHMFEE